MIRQQGLLFVNASTEICTYLPGKSTAGTVLGNPEDAGSCSHACEAVRMLNFRFDGTVTIGGNCPIVPVLDCYGNIFLAGL